MDGGAVTSWRWSLLATALAAAACAQDDFERPPIEYSQSEPDNVVSRLQQRLERGEVELKYDDDWGYLKSLLTLLEAPVESQMLVFSKTSLQRRRISPRTPRAIYFNDEASVGFCQSGDVLEIAAADPKLGTVFYTLDQEPRPQPRFLRQTDNCLVCHSSSRTEGIPGHVVRSVFVDRSGEMIVSAGGRTVDHATPVADRWGGWYVTGRHGAQTHLGNLVVEGRDPPGPDEIAHGMNCTDLSGRFDVSRYLSGHSDIVALMVFEHQALVHNRIVKANFAARQALAYDRMMKEAMGRPDGALLESTQRRIQSAGDDLVDALLLVAEAKLTDPVAGASGYAEAFVLAGPRDRQGRSLRDLDLQTRLFQRPCSFLIYSRSFDALPEEMLAYVWRRLWRVLAEEEDREKFSHLSPDDKRAIVEILLDTKPNLPDYWRTYVSTKS